MYNFIKLMQLENSFTGAFLLPISKNLIFDLGIFLQYLDFG